MLNNENFNSNSAHFASINVFSVKFSERSLNQQKYKGGIHMQKSYM